MKKKNTLPLDFKNVRTYPLSSRKCKVNKDDFGVPAISAGGSFSEFIDGLPKIQAAKDLMDFCGLVCDAYEKKKKIIIAIGGHVIKTGVSPYLIRLIKRGVISMISMNGSAAIHDLEIAMNGKTSEDVAEALIDGSFGMAYETGFHMNEAFAEAMKNSTGAGAEIAGLMDRINAPYRESSLIYNAGACEVPATVHIAVGTDIVHVHPNADGAAIGAATFNDFKTYCSMIAQLSPGSIYINLGSAVIMPEVFLKALTLVRNLGHDAKGFHTANFDMISHYRPNANVLSRPTIGSGGRSFNFIGCHEIMVPLFYSVLNEKLKR